MVIAAGGLVDIGDFGTDASVSVTIGGGMTDADVRVYLQGGMAGMVFNARMGTVTHGTVLGTVPVGYRPPWLVTIPVVPNSSNPPVAFVWVDTDGEVSIYYYGGSGSALTFLRGGGAWPRGL